MSTRVSVDPVTGVHVDAPACALLRALRARGVPLTPDARIVWREHGRHESLLVEAGDGGCWFVKRTGSPTIDGPLSLASERAFYRAIREVEALAWLARVVPRAEGASADGASGYRGSDDDDAEMLVLEGLPASRTARRALLDGAVPNEREASTIGEALGRLHSVTDVAALSRFRPVAQPVSTHGRCTPEIVAHASPAYVELLRVLQQSPRVNARLRELRGTWRCDALIHGDMKLDNVLIAAADPDARDVARLPVLIDWELAGLGDSRWDSGSLIGSGLFAWIETLRPGSDPAVWRTTIEQLVVMLQAYWVAYSEARRRAAPFDDREQGHFVFAWAGYWLVHRVMATVAMHRMLTAAHYSALHIAHNLLLRPTTDNPFELLASLLRPPRHG